MFDQLKIAGLGATTVIALVVANVSSAIAMNQEGHDDWMASLPHAQMLIEAIPEARPLPSRRCPVSAAMLASNPYEQIPLPQHRCARALKSNIRKPQPELIDVKD
jgi:hypothetical protein